LKIEEKRERDYHLAILKEELRRIKEKNEIIKEKFKKSHSHRSFRFGDSHTEEESPRIHDYYKLIPRRSKREIRKPKARVDLPYFQRNENVEIYLDWEMKVENLFTYHQVNEERKLPSATFKLSKLCYVLVDFPRKRQTPI